MNVSRSLLAMILSVWVAAAPSAPSAEQPVALRIHALLGGEAFAYGTVHTDPTTTYVYRLTDLRYYLSKIAVIHDGGQVTEFPDLYVLVDLARQVQDYPIGTLNVESVEGLRLSIGVDKDRNHQDPTLYPATHPLAPQQPTMHWGWAAGYRFCTMDGYAGPMGSQPSTRFEVHAVGDELYKTITLDVATVYENGKLVLQLNAEYGNLLDGIQAQWGPLTHGSEGEAAVLMQNFATKVFSAPVVSVDEQFTAPHLQVWPNPASDQLVVRTSSAEAQIRVVDLTGRVCWSGTASNGQTAVPAWDIPAGSYLLIVQDGQGRTSTERIAVLH